MKTKLWVIFEVCDTGYSDTSGKVTYNEPTDICIKKSLARMFLEKYGKVEHVTDTYMSVSDGNRDQIAFAQLWETRD